MYMMKKTHPFVHYMLPCTIEKQFQCIANIIKTMLDLRDDFFRHPEEKLQYSFEQLHSNMHFHP